MPLPCAKCRKDSLTKCEHCQLPHCSDDCLEATHAPLGSACAVESIGEPVRSEVIIKRDDVEIAITELIGEGAYGKVYAACYNTNCDTVVKLQGLTSEPVDGLTHVSHFNREAYITSLASDKDFGPMTYFAEVFWTLAIPRPTTPSGKFNSWLRTLDPRIDRIGVIVQDEWSGSLDKLPVQYWQNMNDPRAVRNLDTLQRLLIYRTNSMWAYGLVHGDLLSKNVLVELDKDFVIVNATLADFGLSFFIKQVRPSKLQILYDYFKHPGQRERAAFNAPRLKDNFNPEAIVEFPQLLDYVLADYLVAVRNQQASEVFV